MPGSTSRRVPASAARALLVAAAVALACAPKPRATLAALCSGGTAAARISATIDTTRPPAGPALGAAVGSHFALTFTFTAPTARGAESDCSGAAGSAAFSGTLPPPLRTAASTAGRATWRIDGRILLLDLNPGTRDNNLFVALPVNGGRGHWGLSTFAGEVAAGATTPLP